MSNTALTDLLVAQVVHAQKESPDPDSFEAAASAYAAHPLNHDSTLSQSLYNKINANSPSLHDLYDTWRSLVINEIRQDEKALAELDSQIKSHELLKSHETSPSDIEDHASSDAEHTKRGRTSKRLSKRKRQRDTSQPPETPPALSTKRFMSLLNPIIEQITATKSASLFMHPINENDAPGYYDLIYHPTDLRTIKSQAKEGSITSLEEFEREIERMFANAVMFNGADSDVCMWTREMQLQIENILLLYKEAKHETSDDDSESTSKRRKR